MRTFLKFIIGLLVLLAIIAVVLMAVSPKNLVFEESEVIEAPSNMVYNMVNDFKKWESWSPWTAMDPNAKNTYSEKSAGVGAFWEWDGEKIGKGSQKIVESSTSKIRTELGFDGWDGKSYSNWIFEKMDDKTKIVWDFEGGDTPFVFRPFNLFMKKSLVKTYKDGLAKIKTIAEQRAKEKMYDGFKINEVTLAPKHYIMNRAEVSTKNIQQFYAQNLGALFGKAQGAAMEMDGMPSGLFFKWDEAKGTTDMAASIPVKEELNIAGTQSYKTPAGRAVQIDYYGDFSGTIKAHQAIDNYIADYGLIYNWPVVEEYVTDPTTEKDPSKWLTKITYYIAENN